MKKKTSAAYWHPDDEDDQDQRDRDAIARARQLSTRTPRSAARSDEDRFEVIREFLLRRGGDALFVERTRFSGGVALRFTARDGHRSRVIIDREHLAAVIGVLADELERST